MFIYNKTVVTLTRLSKCLLRSTISSEKYVCSQINKDLYYSAFNRQLSTIESAKSLKANTRESEDLLSIDTHIQELDYVAITNGDKDLEHKLKVLTLETEVMRQEGLMVPPQSSMTTEHWRELLQRDSKASRRKFLTYLFKIYNTKEKKKFKKLEKQQAFEEKKHELVKKSLPLEEHALHYGLQHNNLFLRIQDQTMNKMENNKLVQAMRFGEKIIVDCGYDKNMTKRENVNCAKQLMLVFAENRAHKDPYDLHFCNFDRESDIAISFKKHIPTMDDLDFPINVHEKSYLDLYPKEKLVYLTPHCRQDMLEYNPDEIYIIGAIVDKINNEPLSLAKAKREGVRMMKLPLEKYLLWGAGSGKSLTLNQCISILLDLKMSGNWEYALRHVPRRKLADQETFIKHRDYKSSSNQFQNRKKWAPRDKFSFKKW